MESLCNILILLFKDVSARDILKNKIVYDGVREETFRNLASTHLLQYSGNDIRNLYSYLCDETDRIEVRGTATAGTTQKVNVMDVLRRFNNLILKETEGIPVCRYRYLLKWRMVSFKLEEELFTTSFLAWRDQEKHRELRTDFGWKYIIGNDNVVLNNILNRGLVDNHFHLKGSAPYFYMSWINLMNQVDNPYFMKSLGKYDNNRLDGMEPYHSEAAEEKLSVLQLQAALIRVYLYSWLTGRTFRIQENNYVPFEKVREMADWSDFDAHKGIGRSLWGIYEKQDKIGEYGRVFADRIIFLFFLSERMSGKKRKKVEWVCRNMLKGMKMEELLPGGKEDQITERELIQKCFTTGQRINLNREFVSLFVKSDQREAMEEGIALHTVEALVNDPALLEWSRERLQGLLENLRSENRHPYDKQNFDYMQNRFGEEYDDLYGERWFLYMMFRKIYEKDAAALLRGNLFYAYLIIKGRIRAELIQVNDRVGFDNFLRYQNRKEEFIDHTPLSRVYSRHAVVSSFNGQPLNTLEARIVPRATAEKNRDYIRRLDQEILEKEEKGNRKFINGKELSARDFFYVFHFVKEPENEKESINTYQCRHYSLRKKVKKQAAGIYYLRERYEKEASRVYGIDACSPEIGCRPEVFAQAFRFLKYEQNYLNGMQSEHRRPRLWTTYHVGEDFLDIIDGMRAIDEAVYFLNMTHGDRLGHALALGVSPREWYAFKGNRVLCCKQDILDNIVWIHQKIRKYNIKDTEAILMKLKRNFVHFYQDIYKNGSWEEDGDIDLYYDAWKLRGDNPELYYRDEMEERIKKGLSVWDAYDRNTKYEELDIIRREPRCVRLYHRYHYDKTAREAGKRVVEYKVDQDIIEVVQKIQYHLQRDILEKGLAIETNPSSNHQIGTFRSYDKHPIIEWYNKGLTNDAEKLRRCPQLDVTINTDDQAVFGTSLENEFALMAIALEKATDETGALLYKKDMIYSWLNEIRKNGATRCFQQLRGETRIEEGNL